jgi:HEAT repeat protein
VRIGNLVSTLTFIFVLSTLGFCQGRDPTVAESLQNHNIALTKTALVAALRNPDQGVRALAAVMLAQDKATDTIPSIAEALARESVPRARLNIAMALAALGDERGSAVLKAVCSDSNAQISLRLDATIDLLNGGNDSCSTAVVEILESNADHDYLASALTLAPRFRHATSNDSQKIFHLMVGALQDKEPSVRISAGDALRTLGSASAIPYLENAVTKEENEAVRSQLQAALEALQQRTRPHH